MSRLQYFSYPGFGERSRKDIGYSQAVRIGDRIEISGQGGWDPTTESISPDISSETDQAFSNVELALTHAGGKGWSQVYKVRIYVVVGKGVTWEQHFEHLVRNLKKWCPDHQPVLTGVAVESLSLEGMRVEIEAEAFLG